MTLFTKPILRSSCQREGNKNKRVQALGDKADKSLEK